MMKRLVLLAAMSVATGPAVPAQLLPPPVPPENPITETKRILGKVLFWDEQLSSDGTIACGTCHQPLAGSADPRTGVHPGPDESFGTLDDIIGSPGVVRATATGPILDPLFGDQVQVTGRSSMATVNSAFVLEAFWDGRAGTTFIDPESGLVSVAFGGALESQAVGPILSDVEMAHEGRDWEEVRAKLQSVIPLGTATDVPADVVDVVDALPSYPSLFELAFGDPDITAERIAFAIATYERTLIADQTPWDEFISGNPAAMTPQQIQGWNFFQNSPCSICHAPPLFTTQNFHNVGLRPVADDPGRQEVTGLIQDGGRFKVPTLRNAGLKQTFMHNGRLSTVQDAVLWYRPGNPNQFIENLDPLLPVPIPPPALNDMVEFISNALTDPRVAAEQFPFDSPTLHAGLLPSFDFADVQSMIWPLLGGVQHYNIYRGDLGNLAGGDYGNCISVLDPDPTDAIFVDGEIPGATFGFFYLKTVVDASGRETGLGATSAGVPRTVVQACP